MSKSPVKSDMEIKQLLNDWGTVKENSSALIKYVFDNIFKDIKHKLFKKVMSVVSNDNRLTKYDEEIYDYYSCLMGYYKNTIKIYDDNRMSIRTPSIKNILDGLYSVLNSQLNQFNETHNFIACRDEKGRIVNPIFIEKKRILEKNTKLFIREVDIIKNEALSSHISKYNEIIFNSFNENNFSGIENKILNDIYVNYSERLYKIYKIISKKCISQLNDMPSRDIMTSYYSMFKDEKDNLGAIIKIQIDALEKEEQSKDEENIVRDILMNIREGYQRTIKNITQIEEGLKNSELNSTEIAFEENDDNFKKFIFDDEALDDDEFDRFKDAFSNDYNKFMQLFEKLIMNFTNNIICNLSNNILTELNKIIKNEELLADELISTFSEIILYTNNNEALKACESKDIIIGILETIEIKIESLKENKAYYLESFNNLIEQLKSNDVKISDEEKNIFIYEAFKMWLNSRHKQKFFDEGLKKYIINNFKDKLDKKKTDYLNSMNKISLQFKKEQLLFEISTFEEILNYSVSHLRLSEDENIKNYVDFIDSIKLKIDSILQKYNIQIISPQPHDMFNGKEHEVLMVEKNDGFKKGEIIKVMNNGYKQAETVILRANVIASK